MMYTLKSFVLHTYYFLKGFLAWSIFFPYIKKIKIIGVVGTKGKTSTAYFISQFFDQIGEKNALCSTAVIKLDGRERMNWLKITTPSPWFIYKMIREAVKSDCKYFVLEVSSHAIKQFRIFGMKFDVVVVTNLIPDHLEYHKDETDYIHIHDKLFVKTKNIIFNNNDRYSEYISTLFPHALSVGTNISTFQISDIDTKLIPIKFKILYHNSIHNIQSNLLGESNIYNITQALAATFVVTQNKHLWSRAETLKVVPGRFERFLFVDNKEVIVDYAHSVDSLNEFFNAIKTLKKKKIITVFGACGDRDPNTRGSMGEIIANNSDIVIVTNDDTYSEDPEKIASMVLSGVLSASGKKLDNNVFKILDRREAIKNAWSMTQSDSLVCVLGKGSEQWQIIGINKIPWDDREVVKSMVSKEKIN